MSVLVVYEIHRFQAGFDYNFTHIKKLQTFKWAGQKGYIENEAEQKQFAELFIKTIKNFCNKYKFAQFIIEPRGLAIPVSFPYKKEGIQYKYKNGI